MKELLFGAAYYDEYMPYDRLHFLARTCLAIEAAKDDWALVFKRTFGAVGRHQDYNGRPVIAIEAEVIAPFVHGGVEDYV